MSICPKSPIKRERDMSACERPMWGAKEGIVERQRCQEADDEMCKFLLILEATGVSMLCRITWWKGQIAADGCVAS